MAKTKEMCTDFRNNPTGISFVMMDKQTVEIIQHYKYLGTVMMNFEYRLTLFVGNLRVRFAVLMLKLHSLKCFTLLLSNLFLHILQIKSGTSLNNSITCISYQL